MIYLDSSVALAHLLDENRSPPDSLWQLRVGSSQLLAYEVWNRLHAAGLADSHARSAEALLDDVAMLELSPRILARALKPFPTPVRTLDGLHLATMTFLEAEGEPVELASYDKRLNAAAEALGIRLYPL
ncbi:hypothetical protein BH10PSE9_BH10PSE9_01440 [soil metagenome]